MLELQDLLLLEDELLQYLSEELEAVLIRLNRENQLEDLFRLIGASHLLHSGEIDNRNPKGKILVIGQSSVKVSELLAVGKKLGFEKERFEFSLDYEAGKKYDFKKIQWSDKYSLILVGPMPHSGVSKGSYSSVIVAIENEDGYPPIMRMGTEKLKITKSSFFESLEKAREERLIA